jgi:hypothetical protein
MIFKWLKAWWSIEGFMLWFVLALVVFVYISSFIGMEWLLRPNNGFGRLADNTIVAATHSILALLLLYLLPFKENKMIIIKILIGWIAIFLSFYSFWWYGPVVSVFPLIIGSIRFAIPKRINNDTA